MPANIREIKGRIKAVGNIQRITKTMQLIASARFQKLQKRATEAQAYTRKVSEVVGEVASSLGGEDMNLPLATPPSKPVGRELILVLSASRGFCGSYNANVMRPAVQHIRDIGKENIDTEIVGKKGVALMKFSRLDVDIFHDHIGDTPEYEDVQALAQRYMDDFVAGKYDAVRVAYMRFISMSKQTPEVMTLLPLEPPKPDQADAGAAGDAGANYEFSPSAEELLGELLPITVKSSLYQAFNEAAVSEQLARMVAMKAATDAAGKVGKTLKRQFNRARQAAITTELSEIIAGAAALE
ncbi:MAG: ATP synthase F1 subunit gamma [Phycisphaeraceae bacterium]|nr:ATP synthase F1 subunit gamma [Phycisphaeraceae bacterium]